MGAMSICFLAIKSVTIEPCAESCRRRFFEPCWKTSDPIDMAWTLHWADLVDEQHAPPGMK